VAEFVQNANVAARIASQDDVPMVMGGPV